jgi:cell division septation protein DedD
VASILSYPVSADTLREAVEQGLVNHPHLLLGSSNTLSSQQGFDTYHPGLSLNGANDRQPNHDMPTAALTLTQVTDLKRQDVADDLALGIVDRYLDVLRQEKLLDIARVNLRVHRSVYMTLRQRQEEGLVSKAELRKVSARLAEAESDQLQTEAKLLAAKKQFAKVAGHWPSRLQWPQGPSNNDLPTSVAQAIEQGLDNYLIPVSGKEVSKGMKQRSMIALSNTIRQSWEDWTNAGLQLNPLKKLVAETEQIRNDRQQQFKEGKLSAHKFLQDQTKYYQAETDYVQSLTNELIARYQILNSIGRLVPFVHKDDVEDEVSTANKEVVTTAEKTLLQMADLENAGYPYPSYKPQFQAEMAHTMRVTALNMPTIATKPKQLTSKYATAWYVSAGNFKNKANALALVERLKSLGFMAFLQTHQTGASVLIGPYEFHGHAVKGMERLKDTAHVQGMLVTSKQKTVIG